MKKKKSKPIDSTMRNVKAANKKFEELGWHINGILSRLEALETWKGLAEKAINNQADLLMKKRARK